MGLGWRLILPLGALGTGWVACLVAATRGGWSSIHDLRELNDHYYYRAVVDDVAAGGSYYDVVGMQLPGHGYPTGSPFNWRTPLYAHALGWLGGPAANQVALAILATVAATLAAALVGRALGAIAGGAAGLAVAAASAWWGDPEPPYFTEAWAGLLILVAIAGRGLGFTRAAVVAGALAVFLRELALPFVGLCLVETWARRRIGEAIAWGACLLLYAAHLAGHIVAVASHQVPRPGEPVSDWVGGGGLGFVLATTRMNYALSLLPDWCTALYLPAAVYGLVALGRRVEPIRGTLIGINGYLIAFTVIGRDFHWYWGWIMAPTLALGAAVAPFLLADAIRASWNGPRLARAGAGPPT